VGIKGTQFNYLPPMQRYSIRKTGRVSKRLEQGSRPEASPRSSVGGSVHAGSIGPSFRRVGVRNHCTANASAGVTWFTHQANVENGGERHKVAVVLRLVKRPKVGSSSKPFTIVKDCRKRRKETTGRVQGGRHLSAIS